MTVCAAVAEDMQYVTIHQVHATLIQAGISHSRKSLWMLFVATENICNSWWEQVKCTLYICASIHIAHNMQSCHFRVVESDLLLWLTRHAMPCGKHMKQHDAQLALGYNPLAYKVCIIWEVCCEMATYCKTALGHSQNREAWVYSRLLFMESRTAWVLFFLFSRLGGPGCSTQTQSCTTQSNPARSFQSSRLWAALAAHLKHLPTQSWRRTCSVQPCKGQRDQGWGPLGLKKNNVHYNPTKGEHDQRWSLLGAEAGHVQYKPAKCNKAF